MKDPTESVTQGAAEGGADVDVRVFARICVALADGISSRAEALAAHRLDEEAWDAIEDAWQERLSRAMEEHDGEGVPPLIAAYGAALDEARAGGDVLTFERFAEATRQLQTGDPTRALAVAGVSLPSYLRANGYWTGRMATDPVLAERFQRVVAAKDKR